MKNTRAMRMVCASLVFATACLISGPVWWRCLKTRDVQKGIPFRERFVTLHGLYRLVTGTRSCNGCVKLLDSDQLMLPSVRRVDMTREAFSASAFSTFCQSNGVRYLYVQLPKKLDANHDMLPPGVIDVADENADDLLRRLAMAGVETADWRSRIAGSPQQVAANFYESDTHWNNLASLRAAADLTELIAGTCGEDSEPLTRARALLKPENWNQKVFAGYFSGALAKRTGYHFSKANDVVALWPKFETDLTVLLPERNSTVSGPFLEVAIPVYARSMATGEVRGPAFSGQYAGGGERFVRLLNPRAPLKRKILLIGDSFSRSLRTYLWVAVQEIVSIDPRKYTPGPDVIGMVRTERPDIVIQMHTAAALATEVHADERREHSIAFDYGLLTGR